MTEKIFTIRPLEYTEMHIALGMAQREGWNPGLDDSITYWHTDPHGFLCGFLDDEPIATISAVKHGENYGFIGFYIVDPEYRGQGYGRQMWNAAMKYLGGRIIGLDAALSQQSNFEKYGFVFAHHIIRFEGSTSLTGSPEALQANPCIVPLSHLPFGTVEAYDRKYFSFDRSTFLRHWISQSHCHALGFVQGHTLVGYGVIRECHKGFKIGPLFAETVSEAEALIYALTAEVPNDQPLYIDIPESSTLAVELASKHGLVSGNKIARMYFGKAPICEMDHVFGVSSYELG